MDVVHIERLLYYRRHSLSGLELHEKFDWRATALGTHQSFSDTKLRVYNTASPNIPYSRKLSREKTFANWLKQSILRVKLSRIADCYPYYGLGQSTHVREANE